MADTLPVVRTVKTNNHDVASLMRRFDRMLIEITKSVSANTASMLPFDFGRVEQHLRMMKSFKAWAISEPLLDAPESNPLLINVDCRGVAGNIENDSAWDLAQLVDTAILELGNSESSRWSSGLSPHDAKRFDDYMSRVDRLLAHIKGAEPVDSPESSPREVNAGEGTTGIKFTGTK